MLTQLDKKIPNPSYAFTVYSVNGSIYFAVAEQLPKWPYLILVETIRTNVCDL